MQKSRITPPAIPAWYGTRMQCSQLHIKYSYLAAHKISPSFKSRFRACEGALVICYNLPVEMRVVLTKRKQGVKTAKLWHRRFGHLGNDSLYKLQNKSMVTGISVAAARSTGCALC